MGFDYSDFDVQAGGPLGEPDDTLLSPTDAEMIRIGIQTALARFIKDTLPHLDAEQQRLLASKLPADLFLHNTGQNSTYDANFSVADELTLQIQAVQALRQHVFPGGRLKPDASIREAKEVVTTCNQMIKTLMDSHQRVMNMERFRAVEQATLDVLGELGDDLKEQFLARLEIKLEEIE